MTRLSLGLLALLLLAGSCRVLAHSTPVATLNLRATATQGTYVESWNWASPRDVARPTAIFPEQCKSEPPLVVCGDQGLVGALSVERLGERYSAVVVRVVGRDSKVRSYTLTAAQPVLQLSADGAMPWTHVAKAYVPLGIEHIMLGVDHLMFVAGLLLLVGSRWMLFKTITAFTVAHSLTLAAATLGWVGVPEKPVNAAIALSIVFVAVEVMKLRAGRPSLSARYPWLVAFGFGLLHGFGFAGALTGVGLPRESIPAALLFFNVGVEIGQLIFVFVVLGLMWSHRSLQVAAPRWTESAVVYAMGSVASFWFIGRALLILTPAT
ncbi:MAG: HupE/UreJ family protein [Gammaproteobacteria bacterium]|nr:HupE/UreJ family protein [Gammaproteobacteria bacterium]